MRLTLHTDYALRVLMTLALVPERVVSADELARRHRLSKNHLVKVGQTLTQLGLVTGRRGRGGGLRLARDPRQIRIGALVRVLEGEPRLVECLSSPVVTSDGGCIFAGGCRLTRAFRGALDAFFESLDETTLADLVARREPLRARLGSDLDQRPLELAPIREI